MTLTIEFHASTGGAPCRAHNKKAALYGAALLRIVEK